VSIENQILPVTRHARSSTSRAGILVEHQHAPLGSTELSADLPQAHVTNLRREQPAGARRFGDGVPAYVCLFLWNYLVALPKASPYLIWQAPQSSLWEIVLVGLPCFSYPHDGNCPPLVGARRLAWAGGRR